MKLALCLFKYFPYGGLQRNFLAIAQELMSRGHQITVYTGLWEGACPDGIKLVTLSRKGLSNHSKNRSFHTNLQLALKKDPVDLVIGFNKIPDLDVYYCADTCFATKVYEDKPWWYKILPRARWSLKFEEAVFGQELKTEVLLLSAVEGEAFKKYYKTNPARLHLMPPGISRTRIKTAASQEQRSKLRLELNLDEAETVIAFLGSDYKRKGLDRILKALAALPSEQIQHTTLLVIGRDKRLAEYENLAKSLKVNEKVKFVGQRDDVPNLLFASDCLAHPAYLENTGNVIIEALVAGLPVICTEICGYAFYVKDNNLGKVVPQPFKQLTMNRLLSELLTNDDERDVRLQAFAEQADVYSRPQKAADTIEVIAQKQ